MDSFAAWLEATKLSWFINNTNWVWATCETLHFFGMALLIGCVGILDLRMLGVGKRLPVRPLHRLIPYGIAGFALNLVTGTIFFVGIPRQYMYNVAFIAKMSLIAIAGINVLFFYTTVYRAAEELGPGDDAPLKLCLVRAFDCSRSDETIAQRVEPLDRVQRHPAEPGACRAEPASENELGFGVMARRPDRGVGGGELQPCDFGPLAPGDQHPGRFQA